jgi:hypothetical protein
MRRNEQDIFSDVVSLQAMLNTSFEGVVTQVYESYQRHISKKIKDITDSQNQAKAAKLLSKNVENRNKPYPFDKKRKLDEPSVKFPTNPNYKIPKKIETKKYNCTMHGPNDQHDTEHCHIVKQALLAYKESVSKKKNLQNSLTTKAQKVTKPLSISNNNNNKLVAKSKATNPLDKSKPRPKVNLITTSSDQTIINDSTTKICDICKGNGKNSRAYTTHSTAECLFNTINSSIQHQVVQDEYDKEVEEEQESNEESEVEAGELSDASSDVYNRRRRHSNVYTSNTENDDDIVLNYNQTSESEQE